MQPTPTGQRAAACGVGLEVDGWEARPAAAPLNGALDENPAEGTGLPGVTAGTSPAGAVGGAEANNCPARRQAVAARASAVAALQACSGARPRKLRSDSAE